MRHGFLTSMLWVLYLRWGKGTLSLHAIQNLRNLRVRLWQAGRQQVVVNRIYGLLLWAALRASELQAPVGLRSQLCSVSEARATVRSYHCGLSSAPGLHAWHTQNLGGKWKLGQEVPKDWLHVKAAKADRHSLYSREMVKPVVTGELLLFFFF